MKVLDVYSLFVELEQTSQKISSLYEQISVLQQEIRDFSALDDALKGEGGNAIRSFYSDGHQPFLIFLFQSLVDYKRVLGDIKASVESYEAHPKGFVTESFLEIDIQEGFDNVHNRTIELTEEANYILRSIQDLVPTKQIDYSEVMGNLRKGRKNLHDIIEELYILDDYGVASLEKTLNNLTTMKTYLRDLESNFNRANFSISDFQVKSLQNLGSYKTMLNYIYDREKTERSLDEHSIEIMPIYEIEKAIEYELEGISGDGKAIVDSAFRDLENGRIDRQEFLKILSSLTKLEKDIREGNIKENVDVTLLSYIKKNYSNIGINGYVELISKNINLIGKEVISIGDLIKDFPVAKNWANRTGNTIIKHGRNIAGAGTVLGGVGMVAGFSFGMYVDIEHSGKTVGEAIVHNGAAVGVGLGSSTLAAAGIVTFLSSNPAGWVIAGSVTAGIIATTAFNFLYEKNILGLQDGLDWVGDKIDNVFESVIDMADNVGEAIMDGLDLVNPKNWGWW